MDFREFNRKCLESFLVGVNEPESILLDFECLANYEYSVHLENPLHEIQLPRQKNVGWSIPLSLFEAGRQRDGIFIRNPDDWLLKEKQKEIAQDLGIKIAADVSRKRLLLASRQTNAEDFFKCLITHDTDFFISRAQTKNDGSFRPNPEKSYLAITDKRIVLFSTSRLSRFFSPAKEKIPVLRQIPFFELEHLKITDSQEIESVGEDLTLQLSSLRGESPERAIQCLEEVRDNSSRPRYKNPIEKQDLEHLKKLGEAYMEFKRGGFSTAMAQSEIVKIEKLLGPILSTSDTP